ncbi:MAG: mandelate racemase/muconate lactonizing enzyme family protein [Rhodospirillales bacterium]|nr:mandelate racemase/muconate lactonizing enzyme family protein [Rhodospirillales bacterium]
MKITGFETLRADAGWRFFSFVKITTSSGIEGWSEFNEGFGNPGLGAAVGALGETLIGQDPRAWERLVTALHVHNRTARGGIVQQAIAAIENALLDLRAKDLGVPVAALFGGPIRERVPVYWSHAGSYRLHNAAQVGGTDIRTYDDLALHAGEIGALGYRAIKTNTFLMEDGRLMAFNPGFGRTPGWPELNWDHRILRGIHNTLAAMRAGAGAEVALMLDVNFHFKTEGFERVAETVAPFGLAWLELDIHDPRALADVRRHAPCPIASCETLCGRRDFLPYFDNRSMDIAIVDVIWNGLGESMKIASMAETHEINVAPHNFYGHLSSMISAHFAACVPNLRSMEIDPDGVALRDAYVRERPAIEHGMLVMPSAPGWGIEVDEAAIRAHPPQL